MMQQPSLFHAWSRAVPGLRPWQSLPREGRDTLWLLAMLALVLAPHVTRLPWWASLGAAGALLWRARLAWRDGQLPSRWLLVVLLMAALAMTWLTHHSLIGREAGITLVAVLTTLKSLELRARRDSLVCLYLGFFLILTQFLYSQSLLTAGLMLVAVWGLLTALILGQRPLGRPPIGQVGREAARAMLWGLPLMAVLFVLFPRVGPLWSLPGDARARTGLSDSLALGEVAELAQDDSIALRLTFDGPRPLPEQMYFRGPTLDRFDGKTWVPEPQWRASMPPEVQGTPLRYTMTVEPSALPVVPVMEGTLVAQPAGSTAGQLILWRQGLEWLQRGGRGQRYQIQAQAWPRWRMDAGRSRAAMSPWLALPPGHNPRTIAWARTLQRDLADPSPSASLLADRVLGHVRRANFRYTLSPGLPDDPSTPHLIDAFWLDHQEGFCEHFATAFVVVMRAMGVPSRVVTGYQGAEFNPLDGQYIVRNSNAHAWAEYWEAGRGWVRADPTAAVAPERVERPPTPRPFAGLPGPLRDLDPNALRRMRHLWEAVDHRWNVWVLQYSRGQQMQLLQRLGWPQPDWADLASALGWALALLGLSSGAWAWLTRERSPAPAWLPALRRVHQALAQLNVGEPPGPAPAAASSWRAWLTARWPAPRATSQDALLHALAQFDALRYGPKSATHPRDWLPVVRQIEHLARREPAAPDNATPTSSHP